MGQQHSVSSELPETDPSAGKLTGLRIALTAAVTILLLAIAGIVWAINDADRIKGLLESFLTNLTERPFRINGDFDFSIGREITVRAENIEWGNAVWSSRPNMLTAAKATVSVDLFSLIDQPIVITNAEASDVRLDFEWDQNGLSNWYLADPGNKDPLKAAVDEPATASPTG